MQRLRRRTLVLAATISAGLAFAACAVDDDDADGMPADTMADTMAAMPAAGTAPADLQARDDAFVAAWNGSDPAALDGFFTDDAVVVDDTMTYTGRQQIREQWLASNVAVVSNLQVHDVRWEPSGSDYRATGHYTMRVTLPDTAMDVSGRFEDTWTRGADGQWRVRSMNITTDPPPAMTTGG